MSYNSKMVFLPTHHVNIIYGPRVIKFGQPPEKWLKLRLKREIF